MAIISNADLKTYLKLSGSDFDTFLTSVAERAQSIMEDTFWRRKMEAQVHTETRDGDGDNTIYLREWPLNSITSITIDDTALSDIGTDYVRYNSNNGKVTLMQGVFTKGVQNVVIVYNAGYSVASMPEAIEQAIIELGAIMFKSSGQDDSRLGLKSLNAPEGGSTVFIKQLDPMTLAAAKRFKRKAI